VHGTPSRSPGACAKHRFRFGVRPEAHARVRVPKPRKMRSEKIDFFCAPRAQLPILSPRCAPRGAHRPYCAEGARKNLTLAAGACRNAHLSFLCTHTKDLARFFVFSCKLCKLSMCACTKLAHETCTKDLAFFRVFVQVMQVKRARA
jgi:hypothetical protein